MIPWRRLMLLLSIALMTSGCAVFGQDPVSGYLVTSLHTPYTLDLDDTPAVTESGAGTILRIREPFSGYGVYTELSSNAIADIAQSHGMQKVYFADLETFALFNIWRTQTLTIYGE